MLSKPPEFPRRPEKEQTRKPDRLQRIVELRNDSAELPLDPQRLLCHARNAAKRCCYVVPIRDLEALNSHEAPPRRSGFGAVPTAPAAVREQHYPSRAF